MFASPGSLIPTSATSSRLLTTARYTDLTSPTRTSILCSLLQLLAHCRLLFHLLSFSWHSTSSPRVSCGHLNRSSSIKGPRPLLTLRHSRYWLRSFADFGAAVLGLGYSLVTGTSFQIILKKTIGGFRPHFLDVCQPQLPPHNGAGIGYQQEMYRIDQVCIGKDKWDIRNAMESFPSGHAEIVFAAFGFLTIYLFTHLKIGTREDPLQATGLHARYWRMLLVVVPIVFATYLSSTLVSGYQHHAHDVVFGALIGAVMAVFGYRMAYKGLLCEDMNTVPYLDLGKSEDAEQAGRPEDSPV